MLAHLARAAGMQHEDIGMADAQVHHDPLENRSGAKWEFPVYICSPTAGNRFEGMKGTGSKV